MSSKGGVAPGVAPPNGARGVAPGVAPPNGASYAR
jgi:hypothetical protein